MRERESVCVCVFVCERESVYVCVCEREREREPSVAAIISIKSINKGLLGVGCERGRPPTSNSFCVAL